MLDPRRNALLACCCLAAVAAAPSAEEPATSACEAIVQQTGAALTAVGETSREAWSGLMAQMSRVGDVVEAIEREVEQTAALAAERQDARLGLEVYAPQADAEAGAVSWARPAEHPVLARADRPVVVLIHGLDEVGSMWDELAPLLAQDDHVVLRFGYRNDGPPSEACDALIAALAALEVEGDIEAEDVSRFALVGHSMGGLIARDAATRDALPFTIERVFMIGSPSGGAPLAHLSAVSEVKEQVQHVFRHGDVSSLIGFAFDGQGEAAEALLPGSAYLTELDARDWPADTRLTVIAGVMASPVTSRVRPALDLLADQGVHTDTLTGWLDDAEATVGDGIVTLDSATAFARDDLVIVKGDHRSMLRRWPGFDTTPQAIPVILDRLAPR